MTDKARTWLRRYARLAGVFYLIIIAFASFGEMFVRDRLVVPGDPAATTERIRASEFLWRASIAGELFMLTCAVALWLIFYVLLRPVGRDLALLAVCFNLVSVALEAANKLHLLAVLFPLGGAAYLQTLDPANLQAMAYLSTRSHTYGYGVSLIFFAWACIVLGSLIVRSGFLPKALGVLMQLAGVSYLLNSFALILSPSVAALLFPIILLPAFVGETALCLWLLVKGVDVARWQARAGAAPGGWSGAPA